MKANITYSVEADKIPEEVVRIVSVQLEKISEQALGASLLLRESLKKGDVFEMRRHLEEINEGINSVGIRVFEGSHILAGYIDYLNNGPKPDEEEPDEEGEVREGG